MRTAIGKELTVPNGFEGPGRLVGAFFVGAVSMDLRERRRRLESPQEVPCHVLFSRSSRSFN